MKKNGKSQTGVYKPPGEAKRGSWAWRAFESLASGWMDFGQNSSRVSVLLLIFISIICGATAFVGAVPTRVDGHDDFFLLDNGWRILCGQRPQIDYFSPWGPVMFLVVGMGLALSNASADGIGYGNAIFGLIIGLWALWLTRDRFASTPRIILVIYLTLLVTAPYSLGRCPELSSHAMLYNRYGYALLGLVLVECFQRKQKEKQGTGEILGGISTGVIVALTLFLKASYFAIALPLVITSFLFGRRHIQRVFGLALGFCIVLFAMLSYLSFDIKTMIEALGMAAGARSKALHLSGMTPQLISQLPASLTLAAILFFANRHRERVGDRRGDYKWTILALLVFASDSVLMISNQQRYAMPLLGVFAIMFACRVAMDRPQLSGAKARIVLSRHVFILVLSALLVVPQLASDLLGLANGVYKKIYFSTATGLVRFTEPHLSSLLLYDGDHLESNNGSVYTNYVNNGVALLRKHCGVNDRVLTMDMVNPFPYALKWCPPRGGIAAIAFNYTITDQYRPSFDAYFGDATVVLMPKHPAQRSEYIDGFYKLYVPALFERYQLYAESEWFWLLKRK